MRNVLAVELSGYSAIGDICKIILRRYKHGLSSMSPSERIKLNVEEICLEPNLSICRFCNKGTEVTTAVVFRVNLFGFELRLRVVYNGQVSFILCRIMTV